MNMEIRLKLVVVGDNVVQKYHLLTSYSKEGDMQYGGVHYVPTVSYTVM